MMPNWKSEVKNANGVNTFDGAPLEKTILAWEVLKKSRMCTGMRTAARKKNERHNAWECRFLFFLEVPSGNNQNAIM